jgi:hypothetical protein
MAAVDGGEVMTRMIKVVDGGTGSDRFQEVSVNATIAIDVALGAMTKWRAVNPGCNLTFNGKDILPAKSGLRKRR